MLALLEERAKRQGIVVTPPPVPQRPEFQPLLDSFSEFAKAAWHLIEPATPLLWNWHLEAVCDHLQAVTEGKIQKLIINIPPGALKSSLVSVLWPCWEWARDPFLRFVFASYKEGLSLRDSSRRRLVIQSEWYQARFALTLSDDSNRKHDFHNDKMGYMIALGAGGSTGYRATRLVLDDPENPEQVESEVQRESRTSWLDLQWSTRGNSGCREVLVQQRLHTLDTTGHFLKQGGWEHLRIPLLYDAADPCKTSIGWEDPRQEDGEVIDARIWPPEKIADMKVRLGPYGFAGQAQQRPAPKSGGMFSQDMFRYFRIEGDWYVLSDGEGKERRIKIESVLKFQVFDTAIKTNQLNDYTVCGTAAVTLQGDLLILDVQRTKIEVPDQYEFTVRCRERETGIAYQFVEDKASGQGIIQEGRRKAHPFYDLAQRIKDQGGGNILSEDKTQRALTVSIMYQNHKVFHRAGAAWLTDYEGELMRYPRDEHDDQVDMAAYAGLCVKFGPKPTERQPKRLEPVKPPDNRDWRAQAPKADWRTGMPT